MLVFYLPDVTLGKYPGATSMENKLPPEERAYRRGFDQGIAFLLMDLGLPNNVIQECFYKKRVSWWRNYQMCFSLKVPEPAPRMKEDEKAHMREMLLLFLDNDNVRKGDA
jgi:hypothetical protein